MKVKWLYHPRPLLNEGLNGYLLRLANGNQVSSVRSLLQGETISPEILIKGLGYSLEQPELKRLFIQLDSSGNHPVWNKTTCRYCPDCLREKVYWRQDWELSLITLCPNHNCRLVEVCPKCNHSLSWKRPELAKCSCGYDLRMTSLKGVEVKEAKLAQVLINKIREKDSEIAYLQPLDLKQLHNLIITLGVYANPKDRQKLRDQRISTLQEAHSLLNIAAEILLNWPRGFYQMLDRIQQSYGAENTARLGKRFGRFYDYLYSKYKGREFGFLLHAFENYLEKNWRHSFADRNKRLSKKLRNKHIWVPVRTISKELGVGVKQITSLAEAGEIERSEITTSKGRKLLCVNRQQLDWIRGLLKDRVDLKMAADIFNVQESRVLQLLKHHLLGKVISPKENSGSHWRISRTSLDQILILGSDLPDWNSSTDPAHCNLGHALRYWLHKPYLFPQLIIAVIKEEILPVATDKNQLGLKAWVFDSKALKQWIAIQIHEMHNGAMTIPEASKVLKIKQEVAYHAVNSGLLKVIVEKDSLTRLVTLSSIEKFMKTYVLGIELSRKFKTSPKHLAELLSTKLVFPISGLKTDGARQNIYRRNHMLDDALKQLNLESNFNN